MGIYIITILSLIFSYYSLKKSIKFLKKFLIDSPGKRSSHSKPTPTGGGLIIAIVGTISTLLSGNIIALICIPLSIIGFFDDLYKLPNLLRYFAQLLTVFFLFSLNFSNLQFFDLSGSILIFYSIFIIISGTAIINLSNFMDGLDGLVGGCFIVIIISSSYINNTSILPLVGALTGFLILNWSPAKLFMGDSGSTFLGAVLTGLIYSSKDFNSSLSLILISSPLLLDSGVSVIRRFLNGQNIFKAHKLNLYQRLNQSGWHHHQVSYLYIFTTSILSLSYMFFGLKYLLVLSLLTILLGIYLDYFVAVPFSSKSD